MKKLLIVNNNMKIGGVQKSLCNLLWNICGEYDVTLCLFDKNGEYLDDIPDTVDVIACDSLFRYLGMSQAECVHLSDRLKRGALALGCRLFGRSKVLRLMLKSQKRLPGRYDAAISYLHNGRQNQLYGGVNEFVLDRVDADLKIAYLHCDYLRCGGSNDENNRLYHEFDRIAACSDGCRDAFLQVLPELRERCFTARNFHRYDEIKRLADEADIEYSHDCFNVLCVARLAHEKGIDRAIRAIKHCRDKGLRAALHLVGDGALRTELEALTAELGLQGAVHFYGERKNPYPYMRGADLLLISSFHEAAPMVIDEAACLGLPTLSVKTTSSDEMLKDCGRVCENSQEGISEALADIITDPSKLNAIKQSLLSAGRSNAAAMQQFMLLIDSTKA